MMLIYAQFLFKIATVLYVFSLAVLVLLCACALAGMITAFAGPVAIIDAIIRSVEATGANVIPVFHLRYKDADRGNHGADHIVEHYFMDGDTTRIRVLINPLMFSLTLVAPEYKPLLPRLNVPVIQAITCTASYARWEESIQGLSTMDVSYSAAQPEFDGALITVPVATREQETIDPISGAVPAEYMPIQERVDKMVRLALNWARLGKTPNKLRKVAVVFHHYPPRNDRIGCAAGLDSFSSVKLLLDRMKQDGYEIDRNFVDGDELAHEMLSRMTCDQRRLPPDQMAARAEAHAGFEHFEPWHAELPTAIRLKMTDDWGKIPSDLFVHDAQMHFAGILNGNIFLTIQPPRGYLEKIDRIYQDMYLSPPHHYLYWHIQQDLTFLGEFILFRDPSLIRSFKIWARKNAVGLAMAENLTVIDLKRMFINPN